jgi:hypothetical protein
MNRVLLFLTLFVSISATGQTLDSARFPILPFNPYENFHYLAFNVLASPLSKDGFDFNDYQYLVPFGLGIEKDLLHRKGYLLSASASINVQFIFRNENSAVLDGIRKTHFNTDFLLRLHNTFLLSDSDKLRLTLFHRSTHLGDDFILLNGLDNTDYWPSDESNYEALQVQYAKDKRQLMYYAGTQLVFRPGTPRKRLEFHHGLTISNFGDHKLWSKLFLGYEIRLLENNQYNLDTDIGIGYLLGETSHVRINFYSGHLPFSRYERVIKNTWIGLGFYLNVSRV